MAFVVGVVLVVVLSKSFDSCLYCLLLTLTFAIIMAVMVATKGYLLVLLPLQMRLFFLLLMVAVVSVLVVFPFWEPLFACRIHRIRHQLIDRERLVVFTLNPLPCGKVRLLRATIYAASMNLGWQRPRALPNVLRCCWRFCVLWGVPADPKPSVVGVTSCNKWS